MGILSLLNDSRGISVVEGVETQNMRISHSCITPPHSLEYDLFYLSVFGIIIVKIYHY